MLRSGAYETRICCKSSSNFVSGQYWSLDFASLGLAKKRMKRYSPKMGPIEPAGGHDIFSMRRGIIGFPKLAARLT